MQLSTEEGLTLTDEYIEIVQKAFNTASTITFKYDTSWKTNEPENTIVSLLKFEPYHKSNNILSFAYILNPQYMTMQIDIEAKIAKWIITEANQE